MLQSAQDLKITEWKGGERDVINTEHGVLVEKLFLGKTQSDKFLDPGWTRVIFIQFKVKEREKKKNNLEGVGWESGGCMVEKMKS